MDAARPRATPALFKDARVKAHTFALEAYARRTLGIPEDAVLLSTYQHPGSDAPSIAAADLARWQRLFTTEARTFEAFCALWDREFGTADFPRSLWSARAARDRVRYLRALYGWNRLWTSRAIQPFWEKQVGFGLRARTGLSDRADLSVVEGHLVRVSERDEAWLVTHGLNHTLVRRSVPIRAAAASAGKSSGVRRSRVVRAVCVGPLALLNHACLAHANVQPYREGVASGLARQRRETDWKAVQAVRAIPRNAEILTFYGAEYDHGGTLRCRVCSG